MKDAIIHTLDELTRLEGASGFEAPVVRYLAEHFSATGAQVAVDPMGNLYAVRGSAEGHPHLMISAHSDEIGGVVRHIEDSGFLRLDPVGGVSAALLVARRVRVGGHPGVVGTKPGHLANAEGGQATPPIEQLYLDVGVDSAAAVAELGIRVGTPVTYDSPLMAFSNPDRFSGKAIDNRLGCAVLLQLFRELGHADIAGRLTGVVAVQEEVGMRGATVAARRANPDYAIVVDTLPVAGTPDVPRGRMPGDIGRGPVLVLMASGRIGGHIGHPKVDAWFEAAAERAEVKIQRATSVGYAVTDAAAVHLRGNGIPTSVLGLPRRYSHSPVCTFDINDAVAAVRLLQQFVADMPNHGELTFL